MKTTYVVLSVLQSDTNRCCTEKTEGAALGVYLCFCKGSCVLMSGMWQGQPHKWCLLLLLVVVAWQVRALLLLVSSWAQAVLMLGAATCRLFFHSGKLSKVVCRCHSRANFLLLHVCCVVRLQN